jgi:oligopeptide/dipeptide ABC transporter ATP-binding protein
MKLLLDLQIDKGLTLLFVTHDLGLARKIADRIGVMLSGRLVEIGPAARVLSCPAHPYTRFLMESARGRGRAAGVDPTASQSTGCPFALRCDRMKEICRSELPTPVDADGPGLTASCFHPLHVPGPEPEGPAADDQGQPRAPSQVSHCRLRTA